MEEVLQPDPAQEPLADAVAEAVPSAAKEALRLREVLDRCAAAGRLRVPPEEAAQAIMPATSASP